MDPPIDNNYKCWENIFKNCLTSQKIKEKQGHWRVIDTWKKGVNFLTFMAFTLQLALRTEATAPQGNPKSFWPKGIKDMVQRNCRHWKVRILERRIPEWGSLKICVYVCPESLAYPWITRAGGFRAAQLRVKEPDWSLYCTKETKVYALNPTKLIACQNKQKSILSQTI